MEEGLSVSPWSLATPHLTGVITVTRTAREHELEHTIVITIILCTFFQSWL